MKTIAAGYSGLEMWKVFYFSKFHTHSEKNNFSCGLILIPCSRNLAMLRPLTCSFQTEVIKKVVQK